ncbi:hypothetical protein DSL72_002539 [Monilinia vaccinii-corymbosi]|uniref:SCP domain-containing protein n=1 Tax=Monilinia vaccinii-corymbosi TaxID=61207 RepID=A0A8A3PCZ1_9HELO|nr:hypothetical protein DSL72_002539 [Monilinia vaccinii-corymbosi]
MYLSFLISVVVAFGFAIATSQEHSRFEQSSILSSLSSEAVDYAMASIWDITDWKNSVGELTSGELDEGTLAPTYLGLSNAASTSSTAHTIASTTAAITTTAAVSSIETKNKASTLSQSLFATTIGLIVADSVTTYPSVVVSLLLNSGFAIAIPQDSVLGASYSGTDRYISSASFSMTSKPLLHINMQTAVQPSISPPSPTSTPTSTSVLSSLPFSPITVFISGHNTSPSTNTQARPEETGFSSPPEFKAQMLWGINWYRQILNHSDLVWDDALAGSSANWTYLCDFWNKNIVSEHYGHTKARYPLEIDMPGVTYNYGITDIINLWGEGASMYYNETDGIYTGVRDTHNETDVFIQMVWKDTALLGCGWNNCPAEYVVDDGHPWLFVVCEYYPKGNTGDATVWTYNVGPINGRAYDQLKSGIPKPSGPGSKSAGSTTTTTLGQHLTTTAGVVRSTNLANRMDQTLYVVIIIRLLWLAV